jgi:signal transduction histidine kinase/DNA-binding response OmpR family regulator
LISLNGDIIKKTLRKDREVTTHAVKINISVTCPLAKPLPAAMAKTQSRLKNSITFRYVGLTSLFFLAIQLAFGVVQTRWSHTQRLTNLEQKIEDTANILASLGQTTALPSDDATLENLLKRTSIDTAIAYSLVVNTDEQIVNSFLNRQMPAIAAAIEQQTGSGMEVNKIVETVKQNATISEIRTPILQAGGSLGEIRIGYGTDNVGLETLQVTQMTIWTSLGVSAILATISLVLFEKEVRSPLRQLASRAIAASETTVAETGETDEFEQLQLVVQSMTEKLQTLNNLQQHLIERQDIEKELEKLSQVKSEFLATISHEIRTPLNAIAGMTGLLADTNLNEEQKEFVDIIRISGERLLAMINNILDLSKIEANKLELEEQPFDLGECVEESLRMFSPQAAIKNLELAYLIEPQTPTIILGDTTRLRQVLCNLLSNAIKFTETGEVVIYVNATPLKPSEANGKNLEQSYEIRFAIKDTGIGIPAARIDRLFQSFSQVDASTSRKYGGTGLGLAISNQLCQLMGGKMWVHSTEGKGSTFYFTMAAQAVARAMPAKENQRDLVGKRVLIVDDNATNQKILTLQAQSWGMYTCAVESGAKALEWLQKGITFDVALLDMDLPNMDGIALSQEIRKQPHCQNLPLVMLTSLAKQEIRQQAKDLHFAAIASKPIQQSHLHSILMQIFTGRPLKVVASSSETATEKKLAESLPLRILVAEDIATNQEVIRLLLEKLGYWADIVVNGREIIKTLRRRPYDVVLMDVRMPDMDGLEATRQICQEWTSQTRPRIIAITAEVNRGDREKCLSAGMDDYLAKPICLEELRKVLSQCRPSQPRKTLDVPITF